MRIPSLLSNEIFGLNLFVDVVRRVLNDYLYIPVVDGEPSSIPTQVPDRRAICYDETNQRLYIYDETTADWRYIATTT